ncbi:restriction endonuclease subunit S [Anaerobiospirillum thomasii]|uniref:EcoKI restriction-modification system protein HsdS n=1 Tax=Anaerobiospirillum thomasii TaxID=179995 RepID=A0A2X0V985_9GAMM|nr:restriction endonuclease subunit S [Anaerobiospirillum thomasii]SPT71024.1 EcoKI restriction-modification system protein HsdS [Anaerobiospirillum thomasii]
MTSIEKFQKLKTDLIELAVRGKLVEQRQEEGTAQELYEKIQKERQKLISEGKLKKEKQLPEISEDESPFEIPKSWIWTRCSNVFNFHLGKTPPRNESKNWGGSINWVSISDISASKNGIIKETKEYITRDAFEDTFNNVISPKNTLVMSFKLSIGKVAFLGINAVHNEAIISIFPIIKDSSEEIFKKYLFHILPLISKLTESTSAIKGKTLNKEKISKMLLPLPPLEEQKRIVESLEAKFKVIDKAIALLERKTDLDKKIKEKILQLAIQGKLVEQKTEEGTAHELYEKIQQERQILISEGKLKKEKLLPEILEDEIPFEIPKSWKWLRIRDLVVQAKQSKPISNFKYIDVSAIDNDKKIVGTLLEYSAKDAPSRARKMVEPGMILFSTVRPYLVNTIIYNDNVNKTPVYASTAFATFSCSRIIYNRFLWYILQSTYFIEYTISCQKGISYPAINESSFYSCFVPVPPLEEQRRIVARIEQLFNIIDSQIVKQDI